MSPLKSATQLDMDFAAPVLETSTRRIAGMVRGDSPIESQRGAVDVLPKVTKIQAEILTLLATEGPLTDRELESRPIFATCGASTVRKRRTELLQAGRIVKVGRRDKLSLWDIA